MVSDLRFLDIGFLRNARVRPGKKTEEFEPDKSVCTKLM
jgi:hypothetical protein